MKKNPILPYVWTAVIGIILIISLSFYGLSQGEEAAGEKDQNKAAANPEEIFSQNCASCHGQNLEGVVGPALNKIGGKYSQDEIRSIIAEGKGSAMPAGLIEGEAADKVAAWLAEKK
ncbi:cytochrome c550 [Pseudalkalibacillus caeni]|uniref:Cytochrome c n=1 Tax=Exobacillus caeni TaxID=2574798 RepID=A0A5R9FES0_9BACL|nr:cytochrome c [Pseudalkalibacillus caeni]TLS39373.1 cytochrome c [Pseudalkalibacillus caeni]